MKVPGSNRRLVLAVSWRSVLRLPSMWLAVLYSGVSGFLLQNPSVLFAVVGFMPEERRASLAILVFLFLLFSIAATRLLKFVRDEEGEDGQNS